MRWITREESACMIAFLLPKWLNGVANPTPASAASARIGDARSTYEDGIISRVNARAASFGLREGISAREFVAVLRRALAA